MEIFYYQNSNLLELTGLRDTTAASGVYINDATVEVTLKDDKGREVTGQVWPLALLAVGSGGNYRGTVEDDVRVALGDEIVAEIVATSGGLQLKTHLDMVVTRRTG